MEKEYEFVQIKGHGDSWFLKLTKPDAEVDRVCNNLLKRTIINDTAAPNYNERVAIAMKNDADYSKKTAEGDVVLIRSNGTYFTLNNEADIVQTKTRPTITWE